MTRFDEVADDGIDTDTSENIMDKTNNRGYSWSDSGNIITDGVPSIFSFNLIGMLDNTYVMSDFIKNQTIYTSSKILKIY